MCMVRKPALYTLIFVTSFIFLFSSLTVNADSPSVRKSLIKSANNKANEKYTFAHCNPLRKKPFDLNNRKKKLLIIGDSQACDFINSMVENGYLRNYQVQLRYIPYQCQPILKQHTAQFIAHKDRPLCMNSARTDNLEQAKDQIQAANIVIFSARWKLKTALLLPHTLRHLKFKPHQRVVVLGSKFFGKISVRRYLRMSDRKLRSLSNAVDDEIKAVNDVLRTQLGKPILFVDQYNLICGSNETCPIFTGNLDLISYDGWHLTKAGARFVGGRLFRESVLGRM